MWSGYAMPSGYGQFRLAGRTQLAHRVAWALYNGSEPDGVVMHTCDNPSCVNPAHLVLGSQRENMGDMVVKGRSATGENHSQSVLKDSEVIAIRQLYKSGLTQQVIADKFGVTQTCVSLIIRNKRWSHLEASSGG